MLKSNKLPTDAISIITEVLKANEDEISDTVILKKGMTNSSFKFTCKNQKYLIRIPGKGTEFLINRRQELDVYKTIEGKGLCDAPIYINPENGYKLTKFLENVKTCNPQSWHDIQLCIEKMHSLHHMRLQVDHTFDIFRQIEFYEFLWENTPSIYPDYPTTKKNIFSLKEYIEKHITKWCLTHIDAIPDNFLFYNDEVQLTDWEYAGMQDPHVDIAMFAIYASYDKQQTDRLIQLYFKNKCSKSIRLKIYCYMAACGLLWSNWCEYKRKLGISFGAYARRQYEYAKEYYKIFNNELSIKENR